MAQKRSRGLLAVLLVFALPALAAAADFYVSPTGSPSGDGSIGNPWNLQTALNQPAAVHPGDTIWLRGGTYLGIFTSNLTGTSSAPISVRQYPGERSTLDGGTNPPSYEVSALTVNGAYTSYIGFEVTNSNPTRTSSTPGSSPPDRRADGLNVFGPGTKIINMVIHDCGQGLGLWTPATNGEAYGNLIYYNGWDAPDRGHGHGIYTQSTAPDGKTIKDNLLFDQFAFGLHAYTEGGHIDNIYAEGNTAFGNGALSQVSGYTPNLLNGGLQVAANPSMISNYTYTPNAIGGNNDLGYDAGCTNATVTGNYFAGNGALTLVNCLPVTMTGNTFYGAISGFTQSQYPNNTYYSSRPTGVEVFIRPNTYEAGRANITIYNWDLVSTVSVDLSGVLSLGSVYRVRNAQDFFAAPVLTGTYDGNPVSIPMNGLTVATPVGWSAPPPTGPEFNAFVLTSLAPYNFYDVPFLSPYYPFVYLIAKNGITAGCGVGYFCPDVPVTRAQMAVFLLKGEHGSSYVPPPAAGVFGDVPPGSFAADWIEQLSSEGITAGCSTNPLLYCPDQAVTRAQMAVFLLRAKYGSAYIPPACTGIFQDVECTPTPAFAVDWIEELYNEGITGGCQLSPPLYCPDNPNTRAQMAVFLVRTFALQ